MSPVQPSVCLKLGVKKLLYPGQVGEARVECWSLSLKVIRRRQAD